jgi:tetratricopeptide (TPR) repeat protein
MFYGLTWYSRAKGYHRAWGALGFLSFLGWIILACFPDNSDKDYRAFSMRQVTYCPLCDVSQETTTVSCSQCGFDFSDPRGEEKEAEAEPRHDGTTEVYETQNASETGQTSPTLLHGVEQKVDPPHGVNQEDWVALLLEYDQCYRNREYRKAIKLGQKALRLNPRASEALSMLGNAYDCLGDEMKAAGNSVKAEFFHRRAMEAWRELKGADPRILMPGYHA